MEEIDCSLVLWGEDRAGMLQTALQVLERPGLYQLPLPKLRDAWVRGFGPIGVVMLGLRAERSSLEAIRRGQAPAHRGGAASETLTVHEAQHRGGPFHDGVTDGIYYTYVDRVPGNGAAGHGGKGRADDDGLRFQQFINIIASDGNLGVAQYEGFLNRTPLRPDPSAQRQFLHWLHLVDHHSRGPQWMASFVRQIDRTLGIRLDDQLSNVNAGVSGHFGFRHWWNLQNRGPVAPPIERAQQAILGWNEGERDRETYFRYYFVHCRDQPLLFSRLLHFVRSQCERPEAELRTCCRGLGLGMDAVLIFAAETSIENRTAPAMAHQAARLSVKLRDQFHQMVPDGVLFDAHVTIAPRGPEVVRDLQPEIDPHDRNTLRETIVEYCKEAAQQKMNIHALHVWPDPNGDPSTVYVGRGFAPAP